MQEAVRTELGITVSIGLSITKVLAKIGSKHRKPHGLTTIPGHDIHLYLKDLPVERVWGIGQNTAAFLGKFGIRTALQFAGKDEHFIKNQLSKPYQEIWHELNGRSVYPVTTEEKTTYQSISKAKTFTPASNDETFVFAQLAKNLENACIKARRYNLAATRLIIFLRTKEYKNSGIELKLTRPTAYPADLFGLLREGFKRIFTFESFYRQTGIVLAGLVSQAGLQYTLFDDPSRIEKMSKIYHAVDKLSKTYGKYTVHHAASLPTKIQAQHEGERGDVPIRATDLFRGENKRQRLGAPLLHFKV
jgi:DNA polymerase-4/DNA polymerase V